MFPSTSRSHQFSSRAEKSTVAQLYHSPGTQSRIRITSALGLEESLQALLTCIFLPWRSRKQGPRAKVFLLFLLQPSCLHWGNGCRFRMAPLCCLPFIPSLSGNNRNHLAPQIRWHKLSESPCSSCHPRSHCTHSLSHVPAPALLCPQDVRDTQLQPGRFQCLEQSCTERWNHLVTSACVGSKIPSKHQIVHVCVHIWIQGGKDGQKDTAA